MKSGTGARLQAALGQISESALEAISKHLAAKTASAAVASSATITRPAATDSNESTSYQTASRVNPTYPAQQPTAATDANAGTYGGSLPTQQHNYTSAGPYAYPDPGATSMPGYNNIPFDTSNYNEDIKPDFPAQLAAHNANLSHHHQASHPQSALTSHDQQAHNFLQAYGSPNAVTAYPNGHHASQSPMPTQQSSGSVAWRQFADNMMNTMTPHWSANALMSLGHGTKANPTGQNMVGIEGIGIDLDPNSSTWPMIGYSNQHHGGGQ